MKKRISFFIITIVSVCQLNCTNLDDIDLIIAQPHQVAHAIESHSAKAIAAKSLDTGIANIPLANLELLLAHEQIAAKIVSRMNYINDITKENVHLFVKPVADNSDHINQHTLDWILYLRPNNIEPIVPIFVKNFKAIFDNNRQLLLNVLENYPQYTKPFVQPVIDNLLSLVNNWDDYYFFVFKIIVRYPDAAQLFIKAAIDNLLPLLHKSYGHKIILTAMDLDPDCAKSFVPPIIDNFVSLATWWNTSEVIQKIMKLYPDTIELFLQPVIDNFSSLANNHYGHLILLKMMELNPDIAEQFVQPAIDSFLFLIKSENYLTWNYPTTLEKIIELNSNSKEQFKKLMLTHKLTLQKSYSGRILLETIDGK